MYEVIEDAAAQTRYVQDEIEQGSPSFQPDFYRGPEDIGAVGVSIMAAVALAHLSSSDEDD